MHWNRDAINESRSRNRINGIEYNNRFVDVEIRPGGPSPREKLGVCGIERGDADPVYHTGCRVEPFGLGDVELVLKAWLGDRCKRKIKIAPHIGFTQGGSGDDPFVDLHTRMAEGFGRGRGHIRPDGDMEIGGRRNWIRG